MAHEIIPLIQLDKEEKSEEKNQSKQSKTAFSNVSFPFLLVTLTEQI